MDRKSVRLQNDVVLGDRKIPIELDFVMTENTYALGSHAAKCNAPLKLCHKKRP